MYLINNQVYCVNWICIMYMFMECSVERFWVTTTRKQWQQLHVLTFLGGRESVCKIICAIGDCLDTSGRLEDLPGGLLSLVFGELTDNDILKKVRSLESWHGQLCNRRSKRVPAWRRSQTRKDQGHSSARARCWHSVNWPILTFNAIKLPGQTRIMWSDNIMISYIHDFTWT